MRALISTTRRLTFPDIHLMQRTVMAALLVSDEHLTQAPSMGMPCDAQRIHHMILRKPHLDARVLRDIPVSDTHLVTAGAQQIRQTGAHDARLHCLIELLSTLRLEIGQLTRVISAVAGLAEGNKIIGRVSARLSGLNVVDVQDRIAALAVTALALVIIAIQNVLAHVPENPSVHPSGNPRPGDVRALRRPP